MARSMNDPWTALAQEVLKVVPQGLLVLDSGGRVLAGSLCGYRMLKEGDPLGADPSGRIRGVDLATTAELERLLARVVASEKLGAVALSVPKRYGRQSVDIVLRRIREAETGAEAYLLIAADPEQRSEIRPELLEQLHRLTPTEARVASAIASGMRSAEVAHFLHIGTNTVRTHLKSVFAKTGARTQADLIRILLCGPLWFPTHELR